MFTDFNEELEELNIPLDCQFLVANQHGEQVELLEAYKLRSSQRLKYQNFGNWDPSSGLSSRKASLYNRRTDLENVTFKAGTIDVSLVFKNEIS